MSAYSWASHASLPALATSAGTAREFVSVQLRTHAVSDEVSDAWGVDHEPHGKSVWALFSIPKVRTA